MTLKPAHKKNAVKDLHFHTNTVGNISPYLLFVAQGIAHVFLSLGKW